MVIFEAETPGGKAFDVALLVAIVVSVLAVMIESVPSISATYGRQLRVLEWFLTGLFTLEYLIRLAVVRTPIRYATSFFGVVDLLAVLPSYLSVVLPGSQSLLTIRALRLLRVFRIFKLARYLGQANLLLTALRSSGRKVVIFLGTVLILVLILGSAMYLIEGGTGGFTSIPASVYWAIVTVTTVGYGDVAPITPLGKTLAAAAMILGYSIIAVPTGIVTAEIMQATRGASTRVCPECLSVGHDTASRFCRDCGNRLHTVEESEPERPSS
jgi:voltage-gated potassium channel